MEHKERNEQIRQKILSEIADIEAFSRQREAAALRADRMYQKAIIMSLINIGELSKSFTEDYLATMPQIPWKAIDQWILLILLSNWETICQSSINDNPKHFFPASFREAPI